MVPPGRELLIKDGVAYLLGPVAAAVIIRRRTVSILTPRELEVLKLLAGGLANKEVARALGISVRTAETHRENLSHKLNILTVAGLTKFALRRGLTSL